MRSGSLLGQLIHTFGIRASNIALAAVLAILVARTLGPAGRGIYSLPAILAAFVTSLYSGLSAATSFYLLRESKGRGALRAAFSTAAAFVVFGIISVVALAFVTRQPWAALPAALVLPSSAITMIAIGYCYGINRVPLGNYLNLFTTSTILVLVAGGFFLFQRTASIAITAWIIGQTIVAIVALVLMLFHSRRLEGGSVPLTAFASYAAKVGFVNLVTLLNYRADVYIVATLTSVAALGLYTVAVSGAETLLVLTQVLAAVTLPRIGSMRPNDAAVFTARCVRLSFAASLVLGFAALLLAAPAVRLFFGPAFLGSVPSLQILVAGVVALSIGGLLSNFFTLTLGKPQVPLLVAAISAVTCIGLSIALVPGIGIAGAAIATSSAYVVGQAVAIALFCRGSGIALSHVLFPSSGDIASYRSMIAGAIKRRGSVREPTA